MIVVCDTSPITSLLQIDQLHLINLVFGQVIIPDKVFEELCEVPGQQSIIENTSWIFIEKPHNERLVKILEANLDPGEAAAIVLALELKSDFLIMDERKGRAKAEEMGLKIIGVLGILLQAKQMGAIGSVKELTDQLIEKAEFFINPKLYQHILKLAGE